MEFSLVIACIVFIGIGFVLLYASNASEGFQAGMPGVRCGVDLPTCNVGLQCINGFCASPSMPPLLHNQLPVYP